MEQIKKAAPNGNGDKEQPKVKQSDAIKQLKALFLEANRRKYPTFPEGARVIPSYTDKTTNGLTRCIIDYVKLKGFHIERTGNEGRVIDTRETFTDVIGRERTVGSITRVYSSGTRGTSDLKAVIDGRFVAIEVKCAATKDKQSEHQKNYQRQVEQSGGVYFIAETFEGFKLWFDEIINTKNLQ